MELSGRVDAWPIGPKKNWSYDPIVQRFFDLTNQSYDVIELIGPTVHWSSHMMTSLNGNIFGITGLFCGKFTGHWWIPLTKASDAELWYFLWSVPEQTFE